MKRILLTCAVALAAVVAPAASHAAATPLRYQVGVSDQQASTFTNPLFAALHMTGARYIAPYDVMRERPTDPDRAALDAWITAAHAAGRDILISFEHSHRSPSAARHAPSAAEYAADVKLFLSSYRFVRSISPWNEVNRCQAISRTDGTLNGQPICHNPRAAATYYLQVRKLCRTCRIVGLDVLDQQNVSSTLTYIRRFLRYARPAPAIWGFHNYSDTNRFSTSRTRAMLKATGRGQVWLTETGGEVAFASSFPFNPTRAAKSLGCMFTIANQNKRISRVYVYQFNGAPPRAHFDAGLIDATGTPRPGYYVVQRRQAGPCHA